MARQNVLKKAYFEIFGKTRSDRIFLLVATAFPILQFLCFFVYVNINQVALAFTEYIDGVKYFAGFSNFKRFFTDVAYDVSMKTAFLNSGINWLFSVVNTFISLGLSYLLWKKPPFSGFFQWVALLPSVLSTMVFVLIYRYFILDFLPETFGVSSELLLGRTGMFTVMIIGSLLGYGTTMIVLAGNLNSIPIELVEYAKLEGVNAFQEFCYVVWPFVYPAIVSYLVVGMASFFSSYSLLVSFYDVGADFSASTLGYKFFIMVYNSASEVNYPYTAAASLIFSAGSCVLVFSLKAILDKVGPKD